MSRTISRIAGVLISLVFVLALFPGFKIKAASIVDQGDCSANGSNVTWTLDSDGTLTISGTGETADDDYSFRNRTDIKIVVIEGGVTRIGSILFENCSNITAISLPDSVTSIGPGAFGGCKNLTSITLPNSITKIEHHIFAGCQSLTNITLPNSITSIGEGVFQGCENLTSITLPNSITSIGDDFFQGCVKLTSITIPNSVTSIGERAFLCCPELTSITIPNSVTSIGKDAFECCYELTSITIKKSLYEQCKDAFPNISSDAFHFYTEYEITFKNYDDTVLESKKVVAGETPSYTGKVTPTKPSDGAYSYEFAGWDPKPGAVTGPATYTAVYDKKEIEYEVTFKNYDDTVLESKKVKAGETPSYTGKVTPTKPSDGAYSYEFAGWDPIPGAVTGPATYTAVYDKKEIKHEYEVTFKNYDDTVLESKKVFYGETPSYTGKVTPTKPSDGAYSYEFAGWTDGNKTYGLNEDLPRIEKDTIFKPVFKAEPKPVYTVGEVKGDGIKSDIVIDVHRNVDDENCLTYFLSATIDGTEMKINDQYTATKGSTIITIKKDFLSTLPAGEHEVQVVFNDGSISTKVTIAAKASVPSTGEVTGPATYIGLALIVTACVCGTGVVLLKKRKDA